MERLLSQILLVAAGTAVLALSAKIRVPMWPVDMSLQTLAVLLIAGLYGRNLAVLTLMAYLAEGAMGFPVFQGTPEKGVGLAYMAGPTAGYLMGFVAMAALVGEASDRGLAARPWLMAVVMLVGEAVLLALGVLWLAALFGFAVAIPAGVGAFIVPDVLKIGLAAAILAAVASCRASR
jgi:biotin transport system substrate-specific component